MGGAAVLAVAAAAVLAVRADKPTEATLGSPAPSFELASTDGSTVSLADHRGHDVLLYFSEGVGCDASSTSRPRSRPSSSASPTPG